MKEKISLPLRRLKAKSLLTSIFLHLLALFFIQKQVYSHYVISSCTLKPDGSTIKKITLDIAKQPPSEQEDLFPNKNPFKENANSLAPQQIALKKNVEEEKGAPFSYPYFSQSYIPYEMSSMPFDFSWQKVDFPLEEDLEINTEFQEPSLIVKEEKEELPSFTHSIPPRPYQQEEEIDLHYEEKKLHHYSTGHKSPFFVKRLPPEAKHELPYLKSLSTLSWGDFFTYDLVYFPDGDEYVFALTLMPKEKVTFPRMRQNVYFLIDKSHGIQKGRLKVSVHAILRALSIFHEEDQINIISYDNKIDPVARNLPNNERSRKKIRNLSKKIAIGTIFASADPFKPLNALLYEKPTDALDTIIFLTNGEGFTNKRKNPYLIHNWTAKNHGRFHVHAVATHNDKMSPFLDFFSLFNKGQVFLSHNITGIKRKMQKLCHTISYPIAKDLYSSAYSPHRGNNVQLFPSSQLMPALYLKEPIVLWGKTANLDDFTLFVQGRNQSNWINIKKKVSFAKARKAPDSISRQWAIQQSHQCYEKYLRDQNPAHLLKAEEILSPHGIKSLFR